MFRDLINAVLLYFAAVINFFFFLWRALLSLGVPISVHKISDRWKKDSNVKFLKKKKIIIFAFFFLLFFFFFFFVKIENAPQRSALTCCPCTMCRRMSVLITKTSTISLHSIVSLIWIWRMFALLEFYFIFFFFFLQL